MSKWAQRRGLALNSGTLKRKRVNYRVLRTILITTPDIFEAHLSIRVLIDMLAMLRNRVQREYLVCYILGLTVPEQDHIGQPTAQIHQCQNVRQPYLSMCGAGFVGVRQSIE